MTGAAPAAGAMAVVYDLASGVAAPAENQYAFEPGCAVGRILRGS